MEKRTACFFFIYPLTEILLYPFENLFNLHYITKWRVEAMIVKFLSLGLLVIRKLLMSVQVDIIMQDTDRAFQLLKKNKGLWEILLNSKQDISLSSDMISSRGRV